MAGKVDFGDHLDIAYSRISNNLFYLLLREIAAILLGPLAEGCTKRRISTTKASLQCKAWVRLNLDTPTLIVG